MTLPVDIQDLTKRQARFVELASEGKSLTQSYLEAYGCKYSTAHTNGGKLAKTPKVREALQRLTAGQSAINKLTETKKRSILADIALNEDESANNRISAIKVDTELTQGVKQIQVLHVHELLQAAQPGETEQLPAIDVDAEWIE